MHSRVVGAGFVARQLLDVINLGQLLVGGGLCVVAAGLHARSEGGGGGLRADSSLLILGGGVLAMATLGLLASRLHSRCLLRIYGFLAMLITLGLVAFVGGLTLLDRVHGIADSAFLASNWHYVRDIYPLSKEDFLSLLSRHYTKLAVVGGLLLVVQLVVITATCVLRSALVLRRKEAATASERAGLIDSDDDDDDDDDEDEEAGASKSKSKGKSKKGGGKEKSKPGPPKSRPPPPSRPKPPSTEPPPIDLAPVLRYYRVEVPRHFSTAGTAL